MPAPWVSCNSPFLCRYHVIEGDGIAYPSGFRCSCFNSLLCRVNKVYFRIVKLCLLFLQLKYHDTGREKDCLPQVGQWNMMNKVTDISMIEIYFTILTVIFMQLNAIYWHVLSQDQSLNTILGSPLKYQFSWSCLIYTLFTT